MAKMLLFPKGCVSPSWDGKEQKTIAVTTIELYTRSHEDLTENVVSWPVREKRSAHLKRRDAFIVSRRKKNYYYAAALRRTVGPVSRAAASLLRGIAEVAFLDVRPYPRRPATEFPPETLSTRIARFTRHWSSVDRRWRSGLLCGVSVLVYAARGPRPVRVAPRTSSVRYFYGFSPSSRLSCPSYVLKGVVYIGIFNEIFERKGNYEKSNILKCLITSDYTDTKITDIPITDPTTSLHRTQCQVECRL